MNEDVRPDTLPPLSDDEKAQLYLWAQASPAQRLAWLEEALKLAACAAGHASVNIEKPAR